MNKYIKGRFFMLLLVSAGVCGATAQHRLTLDECLEEALNNNVKMKNAGNDIEAARQDERQAFTRFFPTVSASGFAFDSNKPLISMDVAPGASMSMMKDGVAGGVSAGMPLFAGGQIVNTHKLSKLNIEVNRLKRNLSENEVRLTTEQYFWQAAVLKEKLNTIAAVEKQLASMRGDVTAAVDAGVADRNDLLQVKLRENETKNTRIKTENALGVTLSLLAQYIGHPSDSIDVDATFPYSLPGRPDSLFCSPEASLTTTSEYRLLESNVEAAKLKKRLAVGKNLPTVAVGTGYMYDNIMEKDHPFLIGFATVSVPLTAWWGGSHEVKKHELQLRNARNEFDDSSRMLLIKMRNAWNKLNDTYRQIELSLEAVNQSAENLRLHTDYYQAGTCTMSDLLEAQTIYINTRDSYAESMAQYEISKCEYLQATGR